MTDITIKNIPPELYARLKQLAELNRRSINSEIIACIERAVASRPIEPEAFIWSARLLRQATAAYPIQDDEFKQLKNSGRL